MNARIRKEVNTPYQVIEGTLVIRLGGRKRVLSSASYGGGLGFASQILNHQVEANGERMKRYPTPSRYLRNLASRLESANKSQGTSVDLSNGTNIGTDMVCQRISIFS